MAISTDAIAHPAHAYRIPEVLEDIRLLDLLELSGSTVQASRFLSLSQPTVSRRYRLLAQDFGLEREPRQLTRCRYGSTEAMRWLRLGCRAHRLAAGVARIGADLMHQPLLAGMDWLLPAPVRFRSIHNWAALVREGVIDAALVSGLEIQAASQHLDLSGLQWLELGEIPLGLGVHRRTVRGDSTLLPPVLVPQRAMAPGLHRALQAQGLQLRPAGNSCSTAEQWQRRLLTDGMAMASYQHPWLIEQRTPQLASLKLCPPLSSPVVLVAPKGHKLPQLVLQELDQLGKGEADLDAS
jgi:hypothetical protein